MTKRILGFMLVALILATGANVSASELKLNSPGVVGILKGVTSEGSTDAAWAQHLLDMAKSSTDLLTAPGGYQTSDTEYEDTLIYVGKLDQNNPFTVPSGHDYAFAKYDGQNAGLVLFNLADWGGNVLPEFSYSIWGDKPDKYQISGFLYFDVYQKDVPDGGSMVMLLGLGLVGLAGIRRMLK